MNIKSFLVIMFVSSVALASQPYAVGAGASTQHDILVKGGGTTKTKIHVYGAKSDIDCALWDKNNVLISEDLRPTGECELSIKSISTTHAKLVISNNGKATEYSLSVSYVE